MDLKPLNIFAGILLVSGAGEALSASNDTPPSLSPLSIPNLGITPRRTQRTGSVVIPESSIPKTGDAGHRAHTNIRIFVPGEQPQGKARTPAATPKETPPVTGFFFETPESLACIYGLVKETPGCDPNKVTAVPNGGSKTVAIVDAYDNPSALADLQAYSSQFGLPAPNLKVVYATGANPGLDPSTTSPYGWELEEALDVEMVHALAPNAAIILVEANSDADTDLLAAEDVASQLVGAAGGGEISNSWGEDESIAPADGSHFSTPNIVYFAATGDNPGVLWPPTSANVVAVGGTSISRSFTTGAFLYESTWADAGGGPSTVVNRPEFQNHIKHIVGMQRGVPDIAFDANPNTGVWVYCSTGCGNTDPTASWYIVGGTSVASPAIAAMVNAAGRFAPSTAAELTRIYATYGWPARFSLIQRGVCGPSASFFPHLTAEAWTGDTPWNFCTGMGPPRGLSGL